MLIPTTAKQIQKYTVIQQAFYMFRPFLVNFQNEILTCEWEKRFKTTKREKALH